MDINQLVEGCKKDDRRCQKELFERLSPRMLMVCRRYARNDMEAEDLLQEGFIKTFINIRQYNKKGSFEQWVRAIMVNNAIKNYRKKSYKNELYGVENVHERSTDVSAIDQMSESELLAMISELPEGAKLVFNMFVIEGFSHAEIAEKMRIQESTSRSQLVKARKALQNKILSIQKISI